MPTANEQLMRLNTDLHDLTAAMERVYRELTEVQAKQVQEISALRAKQAREVEMLERRYGADIATHQREYDGLSRRMTALKNDIIHQQSMRDREERDLAERNKRAAANDNSKMQAKMAANDNRKLPAKTGANDNVAPTKKRSTFF